MDLLYISDPIYYCKLQVRMNYSSTKRPWID